MPSDLPTLEAKVPKKQGVVYGVVMYGLALLWVTVFTVTMWRLNALDGPHWLKLCYAALMVAWAPVTAVFLVFVRKQNIIEKEWGFRLITGAFYTFCTVNLAFIGLGIVDYACGMS